MKNTFWYVGFKVLWFIRKEWAAIVWFVSLIGLAAIVFFMASCSKPKSAQIPDRPELVMPDHLPEGVTLSEWSITALALKNAQAKIDKERAEAQQKIDQIKAESDAQLAKEKAKADTVNKAMGVFRWGALAGLGAGFVMLFIGGASAIRYFIIGSILAVIPLFVTMFADAIAPWMNLMAGILCTGGGVMLLALAVGKVWQQWHIKGQTDLQASNLRKAASVESNPMARIAFESQAAVLDHVGTAQYDPGMVAVPKAAVI